MAWLLVGLMFFPALLGLFTIVLWLKSPPPPVDKSNVINRIRLWWFALTRQDKFVDVFPWLKGDEWENINK